MAVLSTSTLVSELAPLQQGVGVRVPRVQAAQDEQVSSDQALLQVQGLQQQDDQLQQVAQEVQVRQRRVREDVDGKVEVRQCKLDPSLKAPGFQT